MWSFWQDELHITQKKIFCWGLYNLLEPKIRFQLISRVCEQSLVAIFFLWLCTHHFWASIKNMKMRNMTHNLSVPCTFWSCATNVYDEFEYFYLWNNSFSQKHHVDGPLRKKWINKKRKFNQESGESIEHHYDHGKKWDDCMGGRNLLINNQS